MGTKAPLERYFIFPLPGRVSRQHFCISTLSRGRFFSFAAVFSLAVLAVSCAVSPDQQAPPTAGAASPQPASLTFESIVQDAPLGAEPVEPFYGAVASTEEWDRISPRLPEAARQPGRQALQDGKGVVVTAYMGRKGSGGYAITIKSIQQESSQLVVTLVIKKPAEGEAASQAFTLPYHLVRVSKEAIRTANISRLVFVDEQKNEIARQDFSLP
jgi:hypothetical protein